jgi:uncharacterized repeat protein (TIGR01451 family)
MIGRTDSISDRWRARQKDGEARGLARAAALLAISVLMVIGGSSTILAQTPKGKVKGVVPTTAPQTPAPSEGTPDGLPKLDQAPPSLPPGSQGPPPSMEPPTDDPRPKRDANVVPTELDDKNPLPPSIPASGGTATSPTGGQGVASDPFALPVDRMSLGKQRVQLSVEVQASAIINLGKESTVRLVVKNESNSDASGVSLVYQLPESLKINSSTPEATPIPGDKPLFHWAKPMLAAGGEWVVVLKVVATSTKACEHAATVTAKTGSRANTIVQEPKLKVEATSSPGRVLKGEQVTFQIAVQNTGTGPARNVIVQAKLSSGLRLGSDDIVEQTISEIGPGQRFPLEPLIVDTVAGGEQTCTVDVRSPDVNPVPEDQQITRKVEVTMPSLTVKLEGQTERFTGQTNEYKLVVKNPGTAPAKKVKVAVTLPKEGGKLIAKPPGATFVVETRKLLWSIAQLEPGQTVDISFVYGTSTPGLYRASAEATSGELRSTDTMTTDVSGIAVLDLNIQQQARVMDVGKTNYYDVTIKNVGTKEATKLLLSGKVTPNLTVTKHFNVDKGDFVFAKDGVNKGQFLFPVIERLAVGQTITLSLEVQATESGPAGCHVFLAHAEMGNEEAKVEDVISTTITGNSRPKTAAKP